MQCKNCGANLVRGFSFCLDCGMPVPPEALEESGLPQRNIDSGPQEPAENPSLSENAVAADKPEITGDIKPQMQGRAEESSGTDLKPKYLGGDAGVGGEGLKPKLIGIGEESSGAELKAKPIGGMEQSVGGADIHATMQSSSADAEDSSAEKLVFCPNCGMRMQHNGAVCDKCGMTLGPKPNNPPSHGIPLFNNDTDAFEGQFGGFGGELTGLSDDEASRIDSFMNGGLDPMFNSGNSSFNVQATPDDFAQLNEQLANFSSAAGMTTIETTQSTLIRQKEPEKGMEREVMDFAMTDDLSSEPVPMSLDGIPVVGDYSMEENPDADINLDPYSFLYNSMDEYEIKTREQYGVISSDGSKGPEPISGIPAISANTAAEPVPQAAQPTQTAQITQEVQAVSEKPIAPPKVSHVTETVNQPFAPSALTATAPAVTSVAAPAPVPATTPVSADVPAPAAPAAPAAAAPTKRCYACGRKMPMNDKFCPNCGRSMFGEPNPNRMPSPSPAPAKKKPTALIIVLIIVIIAAVAAVFFVKNANAAEISDEPTDSVSLLTRSNDNNVLQNASL